MIWLAGFIIFCVLHNLQIALTATKDVRRFVNLGINRRNFWVGLIVSLTNTNNLHNPILVTLYLQRK